MWTIAFRFWQRSIFPSMDRKKGNWYPAVPPLCRPPLGLGPSDYFGRTMVSNLPPNIKVGVVSGRRRWLQNRIVRKG